jgi:hypothetical protein
MKILAHALLLFSLICCEEKITLPCSSDEGNANPEWLNRQIKVLKKSSGTAEIYLYKFDGGSAVVVFPCMNCVDSFIYFYDCDGNLLCESGGFAGKSTCPDSYYRNAERVLIWKEN